MNDRVNAKIEGFDRDRKCCNDYLLKHSKVFRDYVKLEESAFADGKLSKKHKELIATAIAVVKNCEPCLQWHIPEAFRAGASDEEIVEAIGVAMEMGIGPVTVTSRFAVNLIEHYRPERS